jgi:hypothetical protein
MMNSLVMAANIAAVTSDSEVIPRYAVIDLGTKLLHPLKITDSGYVLGGNAPFFYVWFDGNLTALQPMKPGDSIKVLDIDEAGTVAGLESTPSNGAKATTYSVTWSKGTWTPELIPASTTSVQRSDSADKASFSSTALPPLPGTTIVPLAENSSAQIIGNSPENAYLWEQTTGKSGEKKFGGPVLVNRYLPGLPDVSPWDVKSVSSINDGGIIVGTANYVSSDASDPIASGLHGVLLLPLAIVRETYRGSGDLRPIPHNGLDDYASLPIFRSETGTAETIIGGYTLDAVLSADLTAKSTATIEATYTLSEGKTSKATLKETGPGSGIFKDNTQTIILTLTPTDQVTSSTTSMTLSAKFTFPHFHVKDLPVMLVETDKLTYQAQNILADVILSAPLNSAAPNTITASFYCPFANGNYDGLPLVETGLGSRAFRDGSGTAFLKMIDYSGGSSMKISVTANGLIPAVFDATLQETGPHTLQYSNYQRIVSVVQGETPATDGQGIFYIQMPGLTATNITIKVGNKHSTVQAVPVKGHPGLLRTGKLVLIEPNDPFRAPDITTIEIGTSDDGSNPSVQLQMYGQTIVDPKILLPTSH